MLVALEGASVLASATRSRSPEKVTASAVERALFSARLSSNYRSAHCPILRPATVFGKPPESPNCAAGLLPKQSRLPPIVFVTTSVGSGSPVSPIATP